MSLGIPTPSFIVLTSLSNRLQEETSRVEDHLLENQTFTVAILGSFTHSKSTSFENLLEPLQKLLRLSPPVAASMARSPELFDCISSKLSHNKPAIRMNLLRIIGSLCEATEEGGLLLERFDLYDVIRELQISDSAVLVRSMAQELIRLCGESDNVSIHSGHGGSGGQNGIRRKGPGAGRRRTSANTTPPHLLERQRSMPTSPQLGRTERSSMGFFDGPDKVTQTPRRQRKGVSYINGSANIRPASRDGSAIARESSPAFNPPRSITQVSALEMGQPISKSRLPTINKNGHRLPRQSTRMTDSRDSMTSTPATSTSLANARPRECLYLNRPHAVDVTVASSARRTATRRHPSGDRKWS